MRISKPSTVASSAWCDELPALGRSCSRCRARAGSSCFSRSSDGLLVERRVVRRPRARPGRRRAARRATGGARRARRARGSGATIPIPRGTRVSREPLHARAHRGRDDEREKEQRDQHLQLPEREHADDDRRRRRGCERDAGAVCLMPGFSPFGIANCRKRDSPVEARSCALAATRRSTWTPAGTAPCSRVRSSARRSLVALGIAALIVPSRPAAVVGAVLIAARRVLHAARRLAMGAHAPRRDDREGLSAERHAPPPRRRPCA